MKKFILLVVVCFLRIGIVIGYTCSCYCPNSYTHVGTAYSSTCTSSSCESACYYAQNLCTSWLTTYGTCDRTDHQHDWMLRTSAIVGVVIGVLIGATVLVIIIVIMVISCKRKRTPVWTVQTLSQPIDRRSTNEKNRQQFSQGVYYQPISGPVLTR